MKKFIFAVQCLSVFSCKFDTPLIPTGQAPSLQNKFFYFFQTLSICTNAFSKWKFCFCSVDYYCYCGSPNSETVAWVWSWVNALMVQHWHISPTKAVPWQWEAVLQCAVSQRVNWQIIENSYHGANLYPSPPHEDVHIFA